MSQAATTLDPWRLVWGQPYIDSRTLAAAIEQDLALNSDPDFRTRLLVRDSAVALRSYWGSHRFAQWLEASPAGLRIRAILDENLGETGFHAIQRRLVDSIDAAQLGQIFELLGRGIHGRVEIHIAGSVPTLIERLTSRPTEVIELVDEVPPEIRRRRGVLRRIETEFGLRLGQVPSNNLPIRWQDRLRKFGEFGGLSVDLVDVYDLFVSMLPSHERTHQSDPGVLALKLDKDTARHRLLNDGRTFLDNPKLRSQIEENWRFIFQEPLLVDQTGNSLMDGQ